METMKIIMSRILDTDYSLKRKLVSRNSKNCYLSTSLSTCNTSRKDGLFVCKDSQRSQSYQVLLSHLDEIIINNGCFYELGFHQYPNSFYPKGLKYIFQVKQEPHLTYIYAMSNVLLKKELILQPDKAELICKYTLLESSNEIDLVIKPFLAFRNIFSLNKASAKDFKVAFSNNGLSVSESKDYPELFFHFSKKIIFTETSDWYYNFEYLEDKLTSSECKEDLFMPGQMLVSLKENETFSISIGLEKWQEVQKNMYSFEYKENKQFYRQNVNS